VAVFLQPTWSAFWRRASRFGTRIVSKSWIVACAALCALVAFGGVYAQLAAAGSEKGAARAASATAAAKPPTSVAVLAATPTTAASPEAVRLDARRQLYETVDALVQASEFERARRLLDEDVARYADDVDSDWRDLERSYRLLSDCLERPTAKARARAEAFALVSQATSLKPRLLAACGVRAK
jgi:hypothetical protein